MLNLGSVLLIAAACLILGRLLTIPFITSDGPFGRDRLSLYFASLVFGAVVLGWIALVLAEFGFFSLLLLSILWLILVLFLSIWAVRKRNKIEPITGVADQAGPPVEEDTLTPAQTDLIPPNNSNRIWPNQPSWLQTLLLILWLIGAGILFFRPHEFVIGAADAGVYVNLAANISQTGAIIIQDDTLAELDDSLQSTFLRHLPDQERASEIAPSYLFPGFYVTSARTGQVTPQFYPLHAVWQAVAHSLNGVWPALLMTGLWALLGSLAIYLTTREIAGWEAAFIALLGLTINALQVWFARYPTTEALTQFLLWSSLWATLVWLKQEKPLALWGLIAGIALGEVFLVRIDTYFLLVIPGGILAWLLVTKRWQARHWWYFGPIIMLTIHSFGHALGQSRPYFFSIFGYGLNLLSSFWILPVAGALIGAVILLVLWRYGNRLEELKKYQRPLAGMAIIMVVGLVVYGWLIRPYLSDDGLVYQSWYGGEEIPVALNRQNLLRLGWYISPVGIILATAGTCLMIWQIDRQKAVILAAGLTFALLYLWRIQANPHQIYTMRRYVPAVMPFAMVTSGYVFGWLFRQRRGYRFAGLFLAGLWLISLAISARGFIGQVDFQGIITQLDKFDEQLSPDSILIFNSQDQITTGDVLGTPLNYLYGHDAYSLRDIEKLEPDVFHDAINQWQSEGREVYWFGDRSPLAKLGLNSGQPVVVTISGPQLENSYEHKPQLVGQVQWTLEVAPIQ